MTKSILQESLSGTEKRSLDRFDGRTNNVTLIEGQASFAMLVQIRIVGEGHVDDIGVFNVHVKATLESSVQWSVHEDANATSFSL
jgi:hypothetical protein